MFSLICGPLSAAAQVVRAADMMTGEICTLDRAKRVVLLPGGILEEHGPYLPAFTDDILSERLTKRLAQAIVARKSIAKMRALLPGWIELVYDNYNALVIGFSPTQLRHRRKSRLLPKTQIAPAE